HGFARFANVGAFGNEAQAVEVHVGAAGDGDELLVLELLAFGVGLEARHGQRAGGFKNAARVLEYVLDGGADGVGVDQDDLVDQLAHETEGFLAGQLDGGAVGEQADVFQFHALAGVLGALHGVRIDGLHADDFHLGTHGLDVGRYAGNQAAAANR